MSREYPCVHHKDGWCYLDPQQPDACVFGPCARATPSHGDQMRTMDDEELAHALLTADFCSYCQDFKDGICHFIEKYQDEPMYNGCKKAALKWLQEPAGGEGPDRKNERRQET